MPGGGGGSLCQGTGQEAAMGIHEWRWGPAAQQVPESENFVHTHLFLSFHTHILIVYIKIN